MNQGNIQGAGPSPARLTKRLLRLLIPFAFIVIFFVWIVIPMAYSVLWSLVDPQSGWSYPDLFPKGLSLENWSFVIKYADIGTPVLNSFFIAILYCFRI